MTPPAFRWQAPWWKWAAVNVVFVAAHPGLTASGLALPPLAKSLVISAVLFVLPAAGWELALGTTSRALGLRLARVVVISSAAFIGSSIALRVLGVRPTDAGAWNVIWILTNVGFAVAGWRKRTPAPRSLMLRERALGISVFLAAFAFFYWGATRVVPAQVDQDLEVQATAYGLLTRFEPLLLTDRGGVYYFAHPPLLHFYVGGSFLLHGSFEELSFFDEASRRARDGRARRGGAADSVTEQAELAAIYARYNERPYLIETRTPNVFFGAATVALLCLWIGRISRRWWLGLLAAMAYVALPEVFVRTSYGGYYAIGGFSAILILLAADEWQQRRRSATPSIVMGAFAALADHKLVLLPAALALAHAKQSLDAWRTRRFSALLPPAALGFAIGTALFWTWGFAIAPAAFVRDHLHDHLLDRAAHVNPLGYGGYPSPIELWLEFARHTAFVLLPVSVALMLSDRRRAASGRPLHTPVTGVWLIWMAVTAVAFTLIDWRQTKHLMPLLVPLFLGLAPARDAPRWRVVAPVVCLLVVVAYDMWAIARLVRDFAAFRVTPAW